MLVVYMGRIGTPALSREVRHSICLLALIRNTILCSDLICVKVLPLYNSGRRLISPEEQQQHSRVEVPTLRQALPRLKSHSLSGQNPRKKSCFSNLSPTSRGHSNNIASTKQRFCLFARRGGAAHQVGNATQPRNLGQIWQITLYQFRRSVIPTSKRVLSTMLWISLPDLRYTSATR